MPHAFEKIRIPVSAVKAGRDALLYYLWDPPHRKKVCSGNSAQTYKKER